MDAISGLFNAILECFFIFFHPFQHQVGRVRRLVLFRISVVDTDSLNETILPIVIIYDTLEFRELIGDILKGFNFGFA